MGKRKLSPEDNLTFCSIKCKLKSVAFPKVVPRLEEVAIVAHDIFKRTSLLLKAYCLQASPFPEFNISLIRHCMNCVCTRDARGRKPIGDILGEDITKFWNEKFSIAYPQTLEGRGLSVLKQLLCQQLLDCVLVDTKTHFKSRLSKLIAVTLHKSATDHASKDTKVLDKELTMITKEEKKVAFAVATKVCAGKWDGLCPSVALVLKEVLPANVKNVNYDLKCDPSRYIQSTLLISRMVGSRWGGICFLPTRRSNVPSHCQIDTEALAQIFIPHSERVMERKSAGDERKAYNDFVWNRVFDRRKVDRKVKKSGFRFHHEVMTDGVAVTLLYSKITSSSLGGAVPQSKKAKREEGAEKDVGKPSRARRVGLDPGKRNVVTMVCEVGDKLKYTTKQRNFESGLSRYNAVLLREKKKYGVEQAETELSSFSHKTSCPDKYLDYLKAKARADAATRCFYLQRLWRNWRFRIFCKRKSSEDVLLNRTMRTFGEECVIFYGNWSGRNQLGGCKPSPTTAVRKLFEKKFCVVEVDEYKTSATCNLCQSRLCKYRKKNGKLSHARLCCTNCRLDDKRSKRFVDRDENAARNILWVGISPERPACLSRNLSIDPLVAPRGTSSDPPSEDSSKEGSIAEPLQA